MDGPAGYPCQDEPSAMAEPPNALGWFREVRYDKKIRMKTLTKVLFLPVLFFSLVETNVTQAQAPQVKLVISNALLLTMAPGQEKPFVGYITVGNDETITALGAG